MNREKLILMSFKFPEKAKKKLKDTAHTKNTTMTAILLKCVEGL